MKEKKIIPCIYLCNKIAVKGLQDRTLVDADPLSLAKFYENNGADALLIFDMSDSDESHEEALDIIKSICMELDIPVYGAGNVKRMEDIKKLLYAGCNKAALNYSKQGNIEITEEVSKKFGQDKIIACVASVDEVSANKELIASYCDMVLLVNPVKVHDTATATAPQPMMVCLPELTLDKMINVLQIENLYGISGEAVTKNAAELNSLKNILEENGVKITRLQSRFSWSEFKLNKDGLLPVIVQDYKTDEVLMMAYMNREAFEKTLETGLMTYFSRSRQSLWVKGETSGHYQHVQSLTIDCDMDTMLAKVIQTGVACHTGNKTCFFQTVMEKEMKTEDNPLRVFEDVYEVIRDRKVNPKEGSYTNYLFDKGIDKILKKVGEEATEIVIAAKNPNSNEIKYEISDFLYHVMVLMVEKGVTWADITEDLAKR